MHYETEINYEATKELTHKNIILYFITCLLGVVFLITAIIIASFDNSFGAVWFIIALVFSIFAIVASLLYIGVILFLRIRNKELHLKFLYKFNNDHVIIFQDNNGNPKGIKVLYKDIKLYKESKNYYFFYISAKDVFPLKKSEELERIKPLIHFENIRKKKI